VAWLIVSLAIDACLAWYMSMLIQIRQREHERIAEIHLANRMSEIEDSQIRIVAGS